MSTENKPTKAEGAEATEAKEAEQTTSNDNTEGQTIETTITVPSPSKVLEQERKATAAAREALQSVKEEATATFTKKKEELTQTFSSYEEEVKAAGEQRIKVKADTVSELTTATEAAAEALRKAQEAFDAAAQAQWDAEQDLKTETKQVAKDTKTALKAKKAEIKAAEKETKAETAKKVSEARSNVWKEEVATITHTVQETADLATLKTNKALDTTTRTFNAAGGAVKGVAKVIGTAAKEGAKEGYDKETRFSKKAGTSGPSNG